MTLPFENDTSRIVKKYAKHSISQSRVKTFLSVLTIALAVALLSGFALSVIGMETEAKRELLVSSQMLYHNLNDEQMQTLRHDERISDSKIYMQAANTQIENYLVIPVYIEQNNSQIVMDEIVEGQYPIDLYDVAVDKAYLEQLGLPVELGVTITIPFYDGNTENFTVVGGNVKKCAVGKYPKSEKHGNTAQFSEVERSGTQENCGGIGSGCLLHPHPLPVLHRRQSQRVAHIDPNAVVVDKNIAENDRFDLFSRQLVRRNLIDLLFLERGEKALHPCVVEAMSDAAEALYHAAARQLCAKS